MLDRQTLEQHLSGLHGWMANGPEAVAESLKQATLAMIERADHQRFGLPYIETAPDKQLDELLADGGKKIVAVTGVGGAGKSASVARVSRRAMEAGRTVLAIDASRISPSAEDQVGLARSLQLETLPLAALLGDSTRRPLLVVDQLDAVSPGTGAPSGRWNALIQLIELCISSSIQVVAGCRSIDLRSELGSLLVGDYAATVTMAELSAAQSAELLEGQAAYPPGLRRSPLLHVLWVCICQAGYQSRVADEASLFIEYRRSVRPEHVDFAALDQIERLVLTGMDEHGGNYVPRAGLRQFDAEVDALADAGYLNADHHRVGFSHQAVGEYRWAEIFVSEGGTAEQLLDESPDLLIRARFLRLLQFAFAGGQGSNLLQGLAAALEVNRRPVYVAAALSWIGTTRPATPQMWVALEPLLSANTWRGELSRSALKSNCSLLPFADEWFRQQAVDGDPSSRARLVWLLGATCTSHGVLRAEIFRAFVGAADSPMLAAKGLLQYGCHPIESEVADLALRWILDGAFDGDPGAAGTCFWQVLETAAPETIPLLCHYYDRELGLGASSALLQEGDFQRGGATPYSLEGVVQTMAHQDPGSLLIEAAPRLLKLIERSKDGPTTDPLYSDQMGWVPGHLASLEVAARNLGAASASQAAATWLEMSEPLRDDETVYNLAYAFKSGTPALAPAALHWLEALVGDTWEPSWRSRRPLRELIETLDQHEIERTGLTAACSQSESEAWQELTGPLAHESSVTTAAEEPPMKMYSGWTKSPLADETAADLTDEQWLQTMATYGPNDRNFDGNTFSGGSYQISSQLSDAVKEDPVRFAALLRHLPPSTHDDYINAFLSGLESADLEAHANVHQWLQSRSTGWNPINPVNLVRYLSRVSVDNDHLWARDLLLNTASETHPATILNDPQGSDDLDLFRLNRADTIALEALGPWSFEYPDTLASAVSVSGAIDASDLVKQTSAIELYRHIWYSERVTAETAIGDLLVAAPLLASTQAMVLFINDVRRRRWPVLPSVWPRLFACGQPDIEEVAGEQWAWNQILTRTDIDWHDLDAPPHATAGIAKAVAASLGSPGLTIDRNDRIAAVAHYLDHPDEAVRSAAVQWTRPYASTLESEGRDLPGDVRQLVGKTIASNSNMSDLRILHIIEGQLVHSEESAVEAIRWARELVATWNTDTRGYRPASDVLRIAWQAHDVCKPQNRQGAIDLLDDLLVASPVDTSQLIHAASADSRALARPKIERINPSSAG